MKLSQTIYGIFKDGQGHYGAERICGVIRREGGRASFVRVKRIMKENGWMSSHCRRHQRSLTDSRKARGEGYPNLVKGLRIERPFQVLTSDISYIPTKEGFDYLCQVRDVYTNIVLGVCQQEHRTADIVEKTLRAAQGRWHLPEGTILHSDRGTQYTAREVMKQVASYGWRQSFSAVGKPGDNSWSESFFSILKKEIFHYQLCATREVARQKTFEYIELFYNSNRVQKRLGYLNPLQYLSNWQQSQIASLP